MLKEFFIVFAMFSVIVLFADSISIALNQPWTTRAFFSIAAALFDIVLCYNFFLLVLNKQKMPFLIVIFCLSSFLPLLLLSGPFLASLFMADFYSQAFRGFWLDGSYERVFALVQPLRFLRLLAVFLPLLPYKRKAYGLSLVLVFIFISLVQLGFIPGFHSLSSAYKQSGIEQLENSRSISEQIKIAADFDIVALTSDGKTVLAANSTVSPSDYAFLETENYRVWFSMSFGFVIRALMHIALLLFIIVPLAISLMKQTGYSENPVKKPSADEPCGNEELKAILGKK
jgi:hypothetical protein